jgi:hypothetical protein
LAQRLATARQCRPTEKKDPDPLPRAVEISSDLEDWGEITRLLPLPG